MSTPFAVWATVCGLHSGTILALLRQLLEDETFKNQFEMADAFGHPTADVLARLDEDLVLRTDLHGDITIEIDGEQIWVRTQRRIE